MRQNAELRDYTGPLRTLDLYSLWSVDGTTHLRLSAADLLAPVRISRRTSLDRDGGTSHTGMERRTAVLRLVLEKKLLLET